MRISTPTTASLATLALFATVCAASAQSARTASDLPPGPNAQSGTDAAATIFPPGPSGQFSTNTTSSVNVVNTPTVLVGNAVTVNDPPKLLFYTEKNLDIYANGQSSAIVEIVVPPGQRLVIENATLFCGSTVALPVFGSIVLGSKGILLASLFPPQVPFGTGSAGAIVAPLHLTVENDSLKVYTFRNNSPNLTACTLGLSGYSTEVAQVNPAP